MRGADRTLRLANNFRPAAPEKSGDAKKAPATITTCAGAPGSLTTWTYGAHGSIVDDATGRCPYTPVGHRPGRSVELRLLTDMADQRWTRAVQPVLRADSPAGRPCVTVTQR
ncbi:MULTISPECIES: hypothetical protein [Streptomyces]|uniref:hypothetical protein n=1 Tax=unclassified Streptomyces TaxID=2593676 RepID=UPI00088AF640|nr:MULTISPECIES: hypothetical protein [unclassified Streptomyces]MDX3767932.1 hypothetical protein [Streptomyces sp. AK08-01B]MDX3818159.1 hypothetical protein [Streptomyces sp. AK08-01A]SCZ08973.1 hypothetical protein SAMN02745898_10978 [Streptomyces sp. 136MFCol5.1]SFT27942.1 hypothetical protein SAMN04487982_11354 [Streptomyces sp. ok210]